MTAAPILLPAGDLTAAVTVESEMWEMFQAAVRRAGFVLRTVPSGPTQPPRYLLMDGAPVGVHAHGSLTSREYEVLLGISRGMSNGAIGNELHVSEDTIKTHCRRMYKKLGAKDRANAVMLGVRAGILT